MRQKIFSIAVFSLILTQISISGALAATDKAPTPIDFTIEARLLYWMPTFNADVKSDEGDLEGTNVDLIKDLNFSSDEGFPSVHLAAQFLNRSKLSADYVKFSYSGRGKANSEVIFNGIKYPVGSNLDAKMDLTVLKFGYELKVYNDPKGYFAIGLMGDYLKTETSMVSAQVLANTASYSAVLPLVSMSGRIAFTQWASLTLELAGIGYDTSSLIDFAVFIDVIPPDQISLPVKNIGAFIGFRSMAIDVNAGGVAADIGWSGINFGVGFRF